VCFFELDNPEKWLSLGPLTPVGAVEGFGGRDEVDVELALLGPIIGTAVENKVAGFPEEVDEEGYLRRKRLGIEVPVLVGVDARLVHSGVKSRAAGRANAGGCENLGVANSPVGKGVQVWSEDG